MTTTNTDHEVAVNLRCSPVARSMGTPAAGTAPSLQATVLVEVPQPWPKKVEDHPLLSAIVPVADDLGIRVQAIVPLRDPDAPRDNGDLIHVVLYRRPPGPFSGFHRAEATTPAAVLANTVRGLWGHAEPSASTDVLVCAHGRRDRCCGSLGTSCATNAAGLGLDVLRTSHLGGHRFAPTALLLPEGTAWAWLDDDLLVSIASRSIEPAAVREHYRGTAGMDHPAAQLIEAEAFFDTGWSWLDQPRTAQVTPDPASEDRWRAAVTNGTTTWSGIVRRIDRLPQPACGLPISEATKFDDVLEIVELTRT